MKYLLIFFTFLFCVNAVFAGDISQIVFSPETSQTVKPSEAALLRIQLQYAGDSHPTACMKMFTSSVTGEFSSSGANWKKVDKLTINSNWTNKNFYYKDSTAGDYIITVKVVSGVSCANLADQEAQWTVSQNITVMSDVVIPNFPPQSELEPIPSVSSSQPTSSQSISDVSSVESIIESTAVVDSVLQPQPQIKSADEPDKKPVENIQTKQTEIQKPEPKPATVIESEPNELEKKEEKPKESQIEKISTSTIQVANIISAAGPNFISLKKWLMIILGIGVFSGAGFFFIRH